MLFSQRQNLQQMVYKQNYQATQSSQLPNSPQAAAALKHVAQQDIIDKNVIAARQAAALALLNERNLRQ